MLVDWQNTNSLIWLPSKPDHTRFVHSGGDSWLLLSDQTVDLGRYLGLIIQPRYFR
jgi:hypothetical protein